MGPYQTANAGADVEDTPKPGKISALALLARVRHHNGTLRSPQQTSTDAQKGTGEDVETGSIGVNRDQQTNRVNAVSNATNRQCKAHTHAVDESASKETDDGEGTVERGVLKSKIRGPR